MENQALEQLSQSPNLYRKLETLIDLLRENCPWDMEQTPQSLKPCTLEEVYEVFEAIDQGNWESLKDELGDLLLQIVFYARFAKEHSHFSLDDVLDHVIEKMVSRHPHVFGEENCHDADAVISQWEKLKDKEKHDRKSLMDGIPPLPALAQARKIQSRAAKAGFDWPDTEGVLEKLVEEVQEFREATHHQDRLAQEDELGDILFTLVNLARKMDLDPETALLRANQKFSRRFRQMESISDNTLEDCNLDELETLWLKAKKSEIEEADSPG